MTRLEIARNLDEIVAFAEVDRFLDTQVKNYSSGMSLRLAFAVAAHLQPEILLVDEVLAVGDASFQRKCLGKMSSVAHQGRAILFVSHNLEAVQRLCDRCIWLDGGRLRKEGAPDDVIRAYLEHDEAIESSYKGTERPSAQEPIVLRSAEILNADDEPCDSICAGERFSVRLRWDAAKPLPGAAFVVEVRNGNEHLIFAANSQGTDFDVSEGTTEMICRIQENVLRPGDYGVTATCYRPPRTLFHHVERCLRLRVLDVPAPGRVLAHTHRDALVAPDMRWETVDVFDPAAARVDEKRRYA
jgi:lipopolysaccharide transport system ATP-binding protein